MQRRGSVSLQASARTAPESPEAMAPVEAECVGSRIDAGDGAAEGNKGAHRHNRETSRLLRRSATANFLRAVSLRA